MAQKIICYACKNELGLEAEAKVVKSEECPHCYASVRCCKMCKFYDKKSYNECREPSADRIVEKEKANFCDFFVLGPQDENDNGEKSALDAANALFKS